MSLKRAVQTFFRDPEPVSALQDVEPGVNIVDGIVLTEEPLRSPVRGQNCVGYHYHSYLLIRSERSPQPQIQKLREAEVYAPFILQMEGGELPVIPQRRSPFTREVHQELKSRYGVSFHGVEDVILPGARVRIKGKVIVQDGVRTLRLSLISVLEKQKIQKGVSGDRKSRRRSRQR